MEYDCFTQFLHHCFKAFNCPRSMHWTHARSDLGDLLLVNQLSPFPFAISRSRFWGRTWVCFSWLYAATLSPVPSSPSQQRWKSQHCSRVNTANTAPRFSPSSKHRKACQVTALLKIPASACSHAGARLSPALPRRTLLEVYTPRAAHSHSHPPLIPLNGDGDSDDMKLTAMPPESPHDVLLPVSIALFRRPAQLHIAHPARLKVDGKN